MTPKDLSDLIKNRLDADALNMSPAEAAAFAGIDPDTVQHWFDGERLDGHAKFVSFLESIGVHLIAHRITIPRK
jgi:hypothetical protein